MFNVDHTCCAAGSFQYIPAISFSSKSDKGTAGVNEGKQRTDYLKYIYFFSFSSYSIQ